MRGFALVSFLLCAGAFVYSCSAQSLPGTATYAFLTGFFMVVVFNVFSERADKNRPA